MVVRLQTAEGKIKEYHTVRGVGTAIDGEVSGCDKWITKHGREWDKAPKSCQKCDQLDCAIYSAEQLAELDPSAKFYFAITSIVR
jgi:hypothetical protein